MTPGRSFWTWWFEGPTGERTAQPAPEAASRFDAEEWVGEHWRSLARGGAVRAVLVRDGKPFGSTVELRGFEP